MTIRDRNTPLHESIIENDIETVSLYKKEFPEWLHQPNEWGATPLYLAKLLGRQAICDILSPGPKAPLRIQFHGEGAIREVSESDLTKRLGVRYTSTLIFPDYSTLRDVLRQCPWWLKLTPLGRECRWLGALYSDELLHGGVADVAIRWIDSEIGYGLFAEAPLPRHRFVVEYVGLVHRRYRLQPNTNAYCLHYPSGFLRWKVFMVDALHWGNYSRFINHSDTPNLTPICALHKGLLHTVLQTNRPIQAGEELTFSYGNDYWRRRKKVYPSS